MYRWLPVQRLERGLVLVKCILQVRMSKTLTANFKDGWFPSSNRLRHDQKRHSWSGGSPAQIKFQRLGDTIILITCTARKNTDSDLAASLLERGLDRHTLLPQFSVLIVTGKRLWGVPLKLNKEMWGCFLARPWHPTVPAVQDWALHHHSRNMVYDRVHQPLLWK